MVKLLKIISATLLLFNLMGALYGGINLILFPDGSSIELSQDLLQHTPFKNYLFPGIILLSANGFFCGFVLLKLLRNNRYYGSFIIAQGLVLTGWIMIQIFLIRTVFILHFILGGTGVALIILGWLQNNFRKHNRL